MCHSVPMLPITRAYSFPLCAYVGCQLIDRKVAHYVHMLPSLVHKVAHCVPLLVDNHSCANRVPSRVSITCQVSHVKMPLCAYVAHRMPMLPNTWCHYVASFQCHGGYCVLSFPLCGTIVCTQCSLHGAIACLVARQM